MPETLTVITRIDEHGRMPKSRREEIATHLTLFAGGMMKATFGPVTRSDSQNRYWHGFVVRPIRETMLAAGLGPISHDALHAYFRDLYLEPTIETVNGVEKMIRPSTTKLSTTDFHYFCEAVKTDELVLRLGVVFPEPEESYAT